MEPKGWSENKSWTTSNRQGTWWEGKTEKDQRQRPFALTAYPFARAQSNYLPGSAEESEGAVTFIPTFCYLRWAGSLGLPFGSNYTER